MIGAIFPSRASRRSSPAASPARAASGVQIRADERLAGENAKNSQMRAFR
jgi:hypothetical protein